MPKVFGKNKAPSAGGGAPAGGTKKMFTPEQVTKATKDYSSGGQAKWGQILSNMGAAGGTGVDLPAAIEGQAKSMGEQLGGITEGQYAAGTPILDIMRQLEGGMGAKYPVY